EVVTEEEHLQLAPPLREAAQVLLGGSLLAALAAQAHLLVNQRHGNFGLGFQVMQRQKSLDGQAVPLAPAPGQLVSQACGERLAAALGRGLGGGSGRAHGSSASGTQVKRGSPAQGGTRRRLAWRRTISQAEPAAVTASTQHERTTPEGVAARPV